MASKDYVVVLSLDFLSVRPNKFRFRHIYLLTYLLTAYFEPLIDFRLFCKSKLK